MHLKEITIAYGMTETGPVSFETSVHDPLERRVTTVGRVLPHTEVKIVDDQGRVVPAGTPGELLTRGYCVMPGYWEDPEKTAEAVDAARWIRSGDIATLDAEGYCNIVGRLKDMLIRGGENIFPREIEEFLYTHPKIEEVQVIGVPDPKYGEEVCAWIKLHAGEGLSAEEVRGFCKGHIAHFKIPRYIKFVEAFPMTVTGKIQKYVMREQMAEELGLKGLGGHARHIRRRATRQRADCARSQRDGANFRQGRVADGSWGPHPTAPPAPNPGGNSLPPNASIIPSQTLSRRRRPEPTLTEINIPNGRRT
jgi:fatty-acyl-CoA synthase